MGITHKKFNKVENILKRSKKKNINNNKNIQTGGSGSSGSSNSNGSNSNSNGSNSNSNGNNEDSSNDGNNVNKKLSKLFSKQKTAEEELGEARKAFYIKINQKNNAEAEQKKLTEYENAYDNITQEINRLLENTNPTINESNTDLIKFVGLFNPGSMCYANSIITLLFHIKEFKDLLTNLSEDEIDKITSIPIIVKENGIDVNKTNTFESDFNKGKHILKIFRFIYEKINEIQKKNETTIDLNNNIFTEELAKKKYGYEGKHADTNNITVYKILKFLTFGRSNNMPKHEDAYEFLSPILDKIQYLNNDKIINFRKLYENNLTSKITCADSSKESEPKSEPYTIINIPIPENITNTTNTSIKDLIEDLQKEENNTDDIPIAVCGDKIEDTKSKKLTYNIGLNTKYLIIILKRFKLNETGTEYKKNPVPINVNKIIKVDNKTFIIKAISLHEGNVDGGHYTAVIYNKGNPSVIYNNDRITTDNLNENDIKERGYVFLYERTNDNDMEESEEESLPISQDYPTVDKNVNTLLKEGSIQLFNEIYKIIPDTNTNKISVEDKTSLDTEKNADDVDYNKYTNNVATKLKHMINYSIPTDLSKNTVKLITLKYDTNDLKTDMSNANFYNYLDKQYKTLFKISEIPIKYSLTNGMNVNFNSSGSGTTGAIDNLEKVINSADFFVNHTNDTINEIYNPTNDNQINTNDDIIKIINNNGQLITYTDKTGKKKTPAGSVFLSDPFKLPENANKNIYGKKINIYHIKGLSISGDIETKTVILVKQYYKKVLENFMESDSQVLFLAQIPGFYFHAGVITAIAFYEAVSEYLNNLDKSVLNTLQTNKLIVIDFDVKIDKKTDKTDEINTINENIDKKTKTNVINGGYLSKKNKKKYPKNWTKKRLI